jgi:hypothetical protein
VRYEKFATALLLSMGVVLVSATGCSGDKTAPAPRKAAATTTGTQALDLASDIVSGCASGAALVKVLIDLKPENDRCVPEVTPASVCVARGGVVRFKIENGCSALGDGGRPALEITRPIFKRRLTNRPPTTELAATAATDVELFQNCKLSVQRIDKAASHVVLCDVAEKASEGYYKYGLTGQIVPLDPDVEVRPGQQ